MNYDQEVPPYPIEHVLLFGLSLVGMIVSGIVVMVVLGLIVLSQTSGDVLFLSFGMFVAFVGIMSTFACKISIDLAREFEEQYYRKT